MDAVTAAFSGFFDYAGLFPPAGLPLDAVVDRYGRYRAGPHAWMLGRLIVPAERVAETERAAARAGASAASPWRLSVLVGAAAHGRDAVSRLQPHLAATGSVRVEAIEASAATVDDVARVAGDWPREIERYVEIPADENPVALVAALAAHGLHAKIRAGGVVADRFPSTAEVARFLVRAREAGVAIKATAGLHHAIRGEYRLTYEAESAKATMHGFVNLLLAATLLAAGRIDEDFVDACLDDDRPDVFKLSGRAGSWLNGVVTYGEIAEARRSLLHAVGTCSFEEPIAEIEALDFGLKGVDGV
jgi:hypothetical protein